MTPLSPAALVLLATLLASCGSSARPPARAAGTTKPSDSESSGRKVDVRPTTADTPAHTDTSPDAGTDALAATPANDGCEAFNRNRSRLTPEEHMQQFGCPPCPCACQHGKITCAPCAACHGFGGRDTSDRYIE